jgi:6-phosphofructokinase 1
LVIEGRFGEMICYNPPHMDSVPIIEAVNQLSTVNANGSAVQAARALGVSFGDHASTESSATTWAESTEEHEEFCEPAVEEMLV